MPYVIQDIYTGKYGEASNPADLNTARLFKTIRAARSCRGYNPAADCVVEVTLTPVTGKQERKGNWLSYDEFRDKYGSIEWQIGENICNKDTAWEHRVHPPQCDPSFPLFVEDGKKVYQVVWYTQADYNGVLHVSHEPVLCEIHPAKPVHWHAYERKYM